MLHTSIVTKVSIFNYSVLHFEQSSKVQKNSSTNTAADALNAFSK
jgi:hypothetical protein